MTKGIESPTHLCQRTTSRLDDEREKGSNASLDEPRLVEVGNPGCSSWVPCRAALAYVLASAT